MSVHKRLSPKGKERWIARWRDPGGKQHSKSFDTRGEAVQWEADQISAAARGRYLPNEMQKLTVKDIFTQWLYHRPLRSASLVQYEYTLHKHLPPIANYRAHELTAAEVQQWGAQLRTGRTWLDRKDRGVSETTARNAMRHLNSAMKWAVQEGMIPRNPVVLPKRNDAIEPDIIPTASQIQAVTKGLRAGGIKYTEVKKKGGKPRTNHLRPDPVLADMLTLAAFTGARISELAGLLVSEVDYQGGVIRIRKQLGKEEPRRRVELKTTGSRRDIPIAAEVVQLLHRHTDGKEGREYLFLSSTGRPIIHSRAAVKVRRVAEAVGAPNVHFHALRHYFASQLITAGVPIQDVAQVLGHSSPATTLAVYTHVIEGARERVAGAISAAIGAELKRSASPLHAIGE
ncbi:tyrosine-type recombinase/integrase [Corynebacterium aurimucosum]